jgi:cytochrome c oxidase subunit III
MFKFLFVGMIVSVAIALLLIQRLQERPWTQQGVIPASQDDFTSSAPKVGLWVFLGVVSSLFLIFTGAYLMRMSGVHAGMLQMWTPLDDPPILWLNTLLLILASVTIQLASGRARLSDIEGVKKYFTGAGVLTVAFLAGQLLAWRQLAATGNYTAASPAYAFFILLTAVHGLHLIGGLLVWVKTAARVWRGLDAAKVVQVAAVRQSVELCTTYWHFLLLVWICLFALLSAT